MSTQMSSSLVRWWRFKEPSQLLSIDTTWLTLLNGCHVKLYSSLNDYTVVSYAVRLSEGSVVVSSGKSYYYARSLHTKYNPALNQSYHKLIICHLLSYLGQCSHIRSLLE